EDANDDDGDVVRSAAQVGQVDQETARLRGRQAGGHDADFGVGHLTAQPVAAQQEDVARTERIRPLDIDLHGLLGAEAAVDDVAGDVLDLVRIDALDAGELPDEAVVVADL